MGFLRAILDAIKRLLGIGSPVPALHSGSGSDGGGDDEERHSGEQIQPALTEAEVTEAWGDLQACIAKFEAEGIDLVGVSAHSPGALWRRADKITMAEHAGATRLQAVQAAGFADEEHWRRVREYIEAKWSRLITRDGVAVEIQLDKIFRDAGTKARTMSEPIQAFTPPPRPPSQAPVSGVLSSDDDLPAASASTSTPSSPPTSPPIGGEDGAPCRFDLFVELMVAQGCWAEQGLDAGTRLEEEFAVSPTMFEAYASHWSSRLVTDEALAVRYEELARVFKPRFEPKP